MFPSPGPYVVTITIYDKADNQRTARRLTIFDDVAVVSKKGQRSYKPDINGFCTWKLSPSPPIVKNADPNASCNWITKNASSIIVAWTGR